MSLSKKIFYKACNVVPMGLLKKLSAEVYLPYHHTVSDDPLEHIRHLYSYKNISQFNNDLEFLGRNFKPIYPEKLVELVKNKEPLPKNRFLLTFDDGFRECYTIIAPLLKAKGIPAIFFINPAFIDNKKLFSRCKASVLLGKLKENADDQNYMDIFRQAFGGNSVEDIEFRVKGSKTLNENLLDDLARKIGFSFELYMNEHKPFLTSQQLTSLSKDGFTIGAHSWDHPFYPSLSLDEQVENTISSVKFIKAFNSHTCFSFPYSDAEIKQEFFTRVSGEVDLFFGIQNQKNEIRNRVLHRFNAERPWQPLSSTFKGLMVYNMINKLRSGSIKRQP